MSDYTEEEVLFIQEFRRRLDDVAPTNSNEFGWRDDSLIRWIRARDMDLDKAEDMFRKSLHWRIENQIDSILDRGLDPELQEKFPYYLDGVDKSGRPVLTFNLGTWDIRNLIETEDGVHRFSRYTNQMLENIAVAIKRRSLVNEAENYNGTGVQFISIPNMAGYSYRQLANIKAVQALIQLVSKYEAHYPETVAHVFVLNAPAIFQILFRMIKPFLSGRTMQKIQIFSANQAEWQPELLQLIEPNQIREEFGGTMI